MALFVDRAYWDVTADMNGKQEEWRECVMEAGRAAIAALAGENTRLEKMAALLKGLGKNLKELIHPVGWSLLIVLLGALIMGLSYGWWVYGLDDREEEHKQAEHVDAIVQKEVEIWEMVTKETRERGIGLYSNIQELKWTV